jgi:hypothetical protein
MKKLNVNEVNVLSNVVRERVNEVKYEKIKSKLEKDVDFKKLEKLNKEIKELENKMYELRKVSSEVNLKVRNKFNIGNVFIDGNGNLRVIFNDNKNYYNEIMLMSIGRSLDIEEIINKLVEKFSS